MYSVTWNDFKRRVDLFIFPVTSGKNWYVTAYFGMMCLIPMIRLAMDYIDQRIYKYMLVGIFAIYSVLPTLVSYLLQGAYYPDPFNVNRGYSSLWLCIHVPVWGIYT